MGELENRLRAARAYAGLTQTEFAVHLETSRTTIERIEKGLRLVDPDKERWMLERAAEKTGLPLNFLLSENDQPRFQSPSRSADLSALQNQVKALGKQLDEQRRAHERESEKMLRGRAHDRGRLKQIERNLNTVVQAIVQERES